MKNWMKLTAAGVLMTTALTMTAGAANFTDYADKLNAMGMFSGSDIGYELDRAPDRAEASVMLVRMLGAEAEAREANFASPFTDVPQWAAPYVGWLYENGLTAGASATTFDPYANCTAQMYSAFLMRSLGYYETAGDFTYASAVEFASEKGVVDYVNCNTTNFLRDHVVAMSYTALATTPKDSDVTLMDALIASGAINAEAAAPYKAEIDLFREYDATVQLMKNETKMSMQIDMAMEILVDGTSFMTTTSDMLINADMNLETLDNSKMAVTGTNASTISGAALGMDEDMSIVSDTNFFFVDGAYYIESAGEKIVMDLSFDDAMSQLGGMDLMSVNSNPLTAYKSITKNNDGSFVVSYSTDAMMGLIDNLTGGMFDAELVDTSVADITIAKMDFVQSVDAKGMPTSLSVEMDMSMTIDEQVTQFILSMDCTILAVGDAVTVNIPADLSDYKTIEEVLAELEMTDEEMQKMLEEMMADMSDEQRAEFQALFS